MQQAENVKWCTIQLRSPKRHDVTGQVSTSESTVTAEDVMSSIAIPGTQIGGTYHI